MLARVKPDLDHQSPSLWLEIPRGHEPVTYTISFNSTTFPLPNFLASSPVEPLIVCSLFVILIEQM